MSSDTPLNIVPPRRGRAVKLSCGQALKIVNTHGTQVVDTWCFNADDMKEFMSMEHHFHTNENTHQIASTADLGLDLRLGAKVVHIGTDSPIGFTKN